MFVKQNIQDCDIICLYKTMSSKMVKAKDLLRGDGNNRALRFASEGSSSGQGDRGGLKVANLPTGPEPGDPSRLDRDVPRGYVRFNDLHDAIRELANVGTQEQLVEVAEQHGITLPEGYTFYTREDMYGINYLVLYRGPNAEGGIEPFENTDGVDFLIVAFNTHAEPDDSAPRLPKFDIAVASIIGYAVSEGGIDVGELINMMNNNMFQLSKLPLSTKQSLSYSTNVDLALWFARFNMDNARIDWGIADLHRRLNLRAGKVNECYSGIKGLAPCLDLNYFVSRPWRHRDKES